MVQPSRRLSGSVPAWLRRANGGLEVIKEKADVVLQIFELATNGMSTARIRDWLNDNNVPTMAGKGENGWSEGVVSMLLRNQAVIGHVERSDGTLDKGRYPPILDETLFDKARDGIASRRGKGGQPGKNVRNLFSALVFCGACGSKHRYVDGCVRCLRGYAKRAECGAKPLPYLPLETKILDLCSTGRLLDPRPVKADKTVGLRRKLLDVEERLKRIYDDITRKPLDRLSGLLIVVRKLEAEKAELEKQIEQLRPKEFDAEFILELRLEIMAARRTVQHDADTLEKRLALQARMRQLFTRIVVTDEVDEKKNVRYVELYGPFVPALLKAHRLPRVGRETDATGTTATDVGMKVGVVLPVS